MMSFDTLPRMPRTASEFFTIYASFTGALMLLRSMFNDLIPQPVRDYIESKIHHLFFTIKPVSSTLTLIIEQTAGYVGNEVFDAAEVYLRTKISPNIDRLKITKTPRQKHFTVAIEKGQDVHDEFDGAKLKWKLIHQEEEKSSHTQKQYFELEFDKKFKHVVIDLYLPHVLSKSKEIKEEHKVLKLYTRDHRSYDDEGSRGGWGSINLEHPSNFETLAMDPGTKKMIVDDLERFVNRKEFYKRVGKAWKRGYLLYGPPGTGKSSLIAAIANYLKFDVYDLEIASCYSNSDLRSVLLETSNQSIIVIEDIDCSANVRDRDGEHSDDDDPNSKVTLSGLLNFCDGLWSSCGDERIIIFTTNHKEKIDPALLRPGRMDMHIHMSYCTFLGFKILASNYLEIKDHPLFEQIETLFEEVEITPAQIAEELMKSDDVDVALNALVECLEATKSKAAAKDDKNDDNYNNEKENVESKELPKILNSSKAAAKDDKNDDNDTNNEKENVESKVLLKILNSFKQIEKLFDQVEITPAQVAEELMKSDDVGIALNALADCLVRTKSKGAKEDKNEDCNNERENVESKILPKKLKLVKAMENLFEQVEMPAKNAEELKKFDDVDIALRALIDRIYENEDSDNEEENAESEEDDE